MTARKTIFGALGATALGASLFFSPLSAGAAPQGDPDPAHHSTNVNDRDPAHHQPRLVCPTSQGQRSCKYVPVKGFNNQGHPVPPANDNVTPNGVDNDSAHHSTDRKDFDPAHHQPTLQFVGGSWQLVAIPGFDLDGNSV